MILKSVINFGLTLLLIGRLAAATQYYCGPSNNAFAQIISKIFTTPCDQDAINSICIGVIVLVNFCCMQHDQCYDDCGLAQRECDEYFCECLSQIRSNFYCKLVCFMPYQILC
uniref:Phospholipase A(2) n=1 Tax=Syphacia muris TaxID=451379 RepID=A0A0N5ADG9_9BILA